MIYTVTFNPSLDYIVSVDDFKLGLTNRTSSELILPGGKGTNVSTVLKNLGFESTALGFVAGFTGNEIVKRLNDMGIKSDFISIENGISRINLKLKSIDGTEINGAGPDISEEKVNELMDKLNQLKEGDVLVLAGSIPSSMSDNIYRDIMADLKDRGVMIVVDATKDLLLNVLEYHPFLIKPNNHELGEIFDVKLTTREEVIPYGRKLQEKGARNVLVSMAGEGAVLIAEDGQVFDAPAPKGKLINGVGAGDSMVAGFVAGWIEKQDYEYAFHMGVASGSASAFSENLATKEEIINIYKTKVDSITSHVIGQSTIAMEVERPQSRLSNFTSDLLVETAEKNTGEKCDFGVMNIGGIRTSLPEGDITVGNIFSIFPFENSISVITLKGKDVKDLFDIIARRGGEGVSKQVEVKIGKDGKAYGLKINGEKIDDSRLYTIATIDYIANGNDELISFKNSVSRTDLDLRLRDVMLQYIADKTAKGEKLKASLDNRLIQEK